ncbi:MAG: hypothetical protein LBF72_01730 [Holosporales bacterium]|nr:hypothetical protein [Holosporales bacterium]
MDLFPNSSKSVFVYVDPVRNSRTSRYAPLLCSVSPSQNSDFEGFERGPLCQLVLKQTPDHVLLYFCLQ